MIKKKHTDAQTYIHTYTHTYTHTNTHIHTYTHTNTIENNPITVSKNLTKQTNSTEVKF